MRVTTIVAVSCTLLLAALPIATGDAAVGAPRPKPLTFALPGGGTCTVTVRWNPADPLGISGCAKKAAAEQATGTTVGAAPQERCSSGGAMHPLMGSGYGSGLKATQAPLWEPYYLARDWRGDLYVSDSFDNRVREITTSRVLRTIAGSGPAYLGGDQGDGQQATCARLYFPMGITRDGAGDLFVADWYNSVIREIDSHGVITTVAGDGVRGSTGDGGPATDATLASAFGVTAHAGNLYISDTGNGEIREVTPDGTIRTVVGDGTRGYAGDGGQATQAELDAPMAVRFDSHGNMYIADYGSSVIRKVNPAGIISTVAGTGKCGYAGDGGPATQAELCGPSDLSLDSAGDIYVADLVNFRIREIVASTHRIVTVAGTGRQFGFTKTGGLATSTDLLAVLSVLADPAGGFYFTDAFGVFHVGKDRIVRRVAGDDESYTGDGGAASNAELLQPLGVATHGDTVYVADGASNLIRAVSISTHVARTVAGHYWEGIPLASFGGDGGQATNALLSDPSSVVTDAAGDLYVADTGNDVIRKISPTGVITTVAGVTPTCPAVWSCVRHAGYSGDGGPATKAELNGPTAVAVDAHGNLYIADTNNQRIRKVTAQGIISTVAGDGHAACALFVCVATGDGGAATAATLAYPSGIAVHGGNLYIADTADDVVREVAPNGTISTVAGNGAAAYSGDGGPATLASLQSPSGVAVDSYGDLFVADTANAVVREVTLDGVIHTVAGNGPQVYTGHPNYPTPEYFGTYCGDNGQPTALCLAKPVAVAVDADEHLYIADPNNTRVWQATLR